MGDRASEDPRWVFYPTPDNIQCAGAGGCVLAAGMQQHVLCAVLSARPTTTARACCRYLPNATEIAALPAAEQAQWAWALYPGNWGVPLRPEKTTFKCLANNQTAVGECPDTEATKALHTAFKLLDVASMVQGTEKSAPAK